MDLAIGAKQTWVMMDLLTKKGESKVVATCTYPLTAIAQDLGEHDLAVAGHDGGQHR